jgi:hypothetical protein
VALAASTCARNCACNVAADVPSAASSLIDGGASNGDIADGEFDDDDDANAELRRRCANADRRRSGDVVGGGGECSLCGRRSTSASGSTIADARSYAMPSACSVRPDAVKGTPSCGIVYVIDDDEDAESFSLVEAKRACASSDAPSLM